MHRGNESPFPIEVTFPSTVVGRTANRSPACLCVFPFSTFSTEAVKAGIDDWIRGLVGNGFTRWRRVFNPEQSPFCSIASSRTRGQIIALVVRSDRALLCGKLPRDRAVVRSGITALSILANCAASGEMQSLNWLASRAAAWHLRGRIYRIQENTIPGI